ncbi:MAG: hypothetical protein GX596_01395 [Propionibacterium sp.]|nr:hypothetical protein [Propionibacterium sp.]
MNQPNDDLDPDVANILDRATPDRDVPEGLLAGARRKRRRRHATLGGAAAIVAVALAVPIVMQLGQSDIITAGPAETPTPAATLANPCLESPRPEPSGAVEEGAERAWFCGDHVPDQADYAWGTMGPLEALETDPDRLVELWHNADDLPADIACTEEYTLSYALVFEYGDGGRKVLQGELHGCRTTTDGQSLRDGGQELFDLARELWAEQRAASPDLVNPYRPCLTSGFIMTPALEDVTGGALCRNDDEDPSAAATELPEDLVARIRDDILETAAAVDATAPGPGNTGWTLELATRFAESIRLSTNDGLTYEWLSGNQPMRWEPDPELAEAIAVQLDGVAPDPGSAPGPTATSPSSTEAPQPWLPERCTVSGDGIPSSPLDVDETPDAIWICPAVTDDWTLAVVPPVEPLTTRLPEAVELLQDLDAADPSAECESDLGVTYLVVHLYADGAQRVVQVEDFGCRDVIAGEDVLGGRGYFDGLQELWRAQRADSEEMHGRPGPLCPELHSTMPIDHTGRIVGGSYCEIDADAVPAETVEHELDPDLAFEIHAALQGATVLDEPGDISQTRSLVLLTMHGDPFTMWRIDDGRWVTWTQEGAWLGTTLSDGTQAALDALSEG